MNSNINTKALLQSMSLSTKKKIVHDQLCFGLSQVYEHRSTGKILDILSKFPEGINKRRIFKWVELYAPLSVSSEDPLIYKLSDKVVPSIEEAKLMPYWKIILDTPKDKKTNIKSEATKALNEFFSDPSDSNYDHLLNLMSFYKRYSNNPKKKENSHKPALHLQAGAPGLKG